MPGGHVASKEGPDVLVIHVGNDSVVPLVGSSAVYSKRLIEDALEPPGKFTDDLVGFDRSLPDVCDAWVHDHCGCVDAKVSDTVIITCSGRLQAARPCRVHAKVKPCCGACTKSERLLADLL
eukprot:2660498-Rhodomonas_salina.2